MSKYNTHNAGCFVMDRGFFTEDNVKSLAHKHRYIIRDGMLLCNPVTKKQRTILSYFGKDDQNVINSLRKYGSKSDYYF